MPRPANLTVTAAIALLLGAGLVACSSSSSSGSATTTAATSAATSVATTPTTEVPTTAAKAAPDACKVITKEEAGQVVGLTLQDGVASGSGDEQMCQFTADPNGPVGQVSVFVGPAGPKKQLDIDKDTLGHDFTQLSGVGDEAWIETGNVFIRKGDLWASVNVVSLDAPPQQVQDGLKRLAQEIAGQM